MAGRAVVFINYTIAPGGVGHVGWGFELSPGYFCYGAKEFGGTIVTLPGNPNGVFIAQGTEQEMLTAMKTGNHPYGSGNHYTWSYDDYKYVQVQNPNPNAASQKANDSLIWGYSAVGGDNCMDDVYKIIVAYANGDGNILPWPATHWFPKDFFNAINAPLYHL